MGARFLFVIMILTCIAGSACAQHTVSGKIEFERKIHVHGLMKAMDDEDNSWYQRMKSSIPQFNIAYFDLIFDSARCLYKPGREVETTYKGYNGTGPAADNTVYTDFKTKRVSANKNVYEEKFLVLDSMRKIDWKEKDEIRTIANYKCHKAVGRICDSVYVVAFYAEDIPASGGPEMFSGLPGMILELAIPRLHTTWVANKIELTPPAPADFTIPSKGKKVTQKELYEKIQSSLKDWGKWATNNIWWTVLLERLSIQLRMNILLVVSHSQYPLLCLIYHFTPATQHKHSRMLVCA